MGSSCVLLGIGVAIVVGIVETIGVMNGAKGNFGRLVRLLSCCVSAKKLGSEKGKMGKLGIVVVVVTAIGVRNADRAAVRSAERGV